MAQKNPQKSLKEYYCEKCDYKCINKKDYEKHLLTQKHNAQQCSIMLAKNPIIYECNCLKSYKHKQSYNRHRKKCKYIENDIIRTLYIIYNMKYIYMRDVIKYIKYLKY